MQPDENFWKKCEGEQIANAYELEQLLGCGAFGGVFRAVQIANGRRLNKRVAVKLMLSGTIQQEELNFALDLPSHQNLVQHFAGNNVEIRGFPMFYLVMELADCSLADFVKKRGGKISSVEAKAIVRDIAQGLKFLHEIDAGDSQDKRYVHRDKASFRRSNTKDAGDFQDKRYVHRDLKLLNVLQVGGVWKIADFGVAKALDRGTMQTANVMGTSYYRPPELFRNGYVSTKWDVWSLGVMIVEMLTAHFPFEAVYRDELERKIQRENPNLQGVPIEWLDVVKGCLVKDHERRWAAADVLNSLESNAGSRIERRLNSLESNAESSNLSEIIEGSRTERRLKSLESNAGNRTERRAVAAKSKKTQASFKTVLYILVVIGMVFTGVMNRHLIPLIHGDILNASGNKKEALDKYQEAIYIKSDDSYAYFHSAYLKSALGDKEGAIADYNRVIRINPNYDKAYNNRGATKSALGDKEGAIADYNGAIRINPNLAEAYNNRGAAKSALRGKEGVITDYNEAIRINPNYADAYKNRGNAKNDLGDKQGAIADYNEAIRINPNYADAYNNRGNVKKDLGDKQGAIADYNEAIRLNSDHANAYYNRGNTYQKLGEKQKALADFREASRLYQQQGKISDYNDAEGRIRKLGG
jgi:serine/threonine protein kinase/Tfp pilus assembly protein PilF